MNYRIVMLATVLGALVAAGPAAAQCPDCPIKGGKDETTDCYAELASDVVRLNYPFFNPAKPKPAKELRCFDGDPGCDLDGVVNNSCTFDVDLCLRNPDPSLPSCTPEDVTEVAIKGSTKKFPELETLQSAVDALLPATTNVCSTGQSVAVALKGPDSKGAFKRSKLNLKVLASTASGTDKNKVKLTCVPHTWPSHGYDAANTRSNPVETKIDAGNVGTLVPKWTFLINTLGNDTVTSTVTVGEKLVYTSAWNGRIYALDKKKGSTKWIFNTGSSSVLGVQSSVTLTADGRVLVADSLGQLFCLDGKKGTLLWQADAGSEDPEAAHAWASPTVANNRVFIGLASHNDSPCTRGTVVAYDLDTGVELWRQYTVPESICYADTAIECSVNADCGPGPEAAGSPCLIGHCDSKPDLACATNGDCPSIFLDPGECVGLGGPGECWLDRDVACSVDADCPACVPGKGGGITATPAASADGEDLYVASVGCLSFPSIGNSDSMFKMDAATGAIDWVYRSRTTEQFTSFPGGPTYQDYGFLNGPILAEVDGGTTPVAVAGGKDGTLYAVDQTTGLIVWTNEVAPPPSFAGFGLFNASVAYEAATDQFFAALFDIDTYPGTSDELLSFAGVDGVTGWSYKLGNSWNSATIANGVIYTANLASSDFQAFDTTTGAQLATYAVPGGNVMGGVAVENGVVYAPFGNVFGPGQAGVVAYELPAAP